MFQCEACGLSFNIKTNLTRHSKNSCKFKRSVVVKCLICSENVLQRNYFSHIKSLHNDENLLCSVCGLLLSSEDFHKHISDCQRSDMNTAKRSRIEPKAGPSNSLLTDAKKNQSKTKTCVICDITLPANAFSGHVRSSSHKSKLKGITSSKSNESFLLPQEVWQSEKLKDILEIKQTCFDNRLVTYKFNLKEQSENESALQSILESVIFLLEELVKLFGTFKVNFELYSIYNKLSASSNENQIEFDLKSFQTKNKIISLGSDLKSICEDFFKSILTKTSEFSERASGWALFSVGDLEVNIAKCSFLKGGCDSIFELPKFIANKKAVISIQNSDDKCFIYSVMIGLYPAKNNVNKIESYPDYTKIFNLENISFPVKINDVKIFERQNNLSINVYYFENGENKISGPLYFTQNRLKRHVNLLLIESLTDSQCYQHYCFITDLSRLTSSQISQNQYKKFFCDACLNYFSTKEKLDRHSKLDCIKVVTELPTEEVVTNRWGKQQKKNCLTFVEHEKKIECPFIIYCDLETYLEKIETSETPDMTKSFTRSTQKHIPYSIAFYRKCSFDDSLSTFEIYRDKNCVDIFVERLIYHAKFIGENYLHKIVPMIDLTPEQQIEFDNATHCGICEQPFKNGDIKVRDHNHFPSKVSNNSKDPKISNYRHAAHKSCNVNFRKPHFIPVFFHNLKFDNHIFIERLVTVDRERVDVIPLNKESYISVSKTVLIENSQNQQDNDINCFDFELDVDRESSTKNRNTRKVVRLRFLDSYRFLPFSLAKLASNLNPDQFIELGKYFKGDSISLVTRKGVFPYSYVDSFDKLNETKLPDISKFQDDMNKIDENDFIFASKVFKHFKCGSLGEYSDIYLTTDVLLLADVFENFRRVGLKNYGLDPAHYYTVPGYTWSCMLKHTGIELELLTDIDMIHFIRKSVRGGISQCSVRYQKANNEFMTEFQNLTYGDDDTSNYKFPKYDPSSPTSYLMYYDFNNMYAWALSQSLPFANFKWLENVENFNVFEISDESEKGYILEVDLEYPKNLHDRHNDLPFCPENKTTPNCTQKKLILDFYDKIEYAIHYRNLKQVLKHGLILKKIHRILEFSQKQWLKPYIEKNTHLRQISTNASDKTLYKNINNSLFGKSIENIMTRQDWRLFDRFDFDGLRRGAEYYISKPNFRNVAIFNENFCAVQSYKTSVYFNKPIYIGFSILDMSKLLLYDFFYDFLISYYSRENVSLLYVDTDSLTLSITTPNIYKDMCLNISRFDTSNFDPNNKHGVPLVNHAKLGLMKDENSGNLMIEFVGLRSKLYANNVEGHFTKKAKGVKKIVVDNINITEYLKCLNEKTVTMALQKQFRSIKHTVFVQEVNKVALNHFDTKRYLIQNSHKTYAWGHYKIAELENPAEDN